MDICVRYWLSDAYPLHQVALRPRSRRAGATRRGVARSFAQMGEAFGMRQSGVIALLCELILLGERRRTLTRDRSGGAEFRWFEPRGLR